MAAIITMVNDFGDLDLVYRDMMLLSEGDPFSPDFLSLYRHFRVLTPENRALELELEHIKLLKRLQEEKGEAGVRKPLPVIASGHFSCAGMNHQRP